MPSILGDGFGIIFGGDLKAGDCCFPLSDAVYQVLPFCWERDCTDNRHYDVLRCRTGDTTSAADACEAATPSDSPTPPLSLPVLFTSPPPMASTAFTGGVFPSGLGIPLPDEIRLGLLSLLAVRFGAAFSLGVDACWTSRADGRADPSDASAPVRGVVGVEATCPKRWSY